MYTKTVRWSGWVDSWQVLCLYGLAMRTLARDSDSVRLLESELLGTKSNFSRKNGMNSVKWFGKLHLIATVRTENGLPLALPSIPRPCIVAIPLDRIRIPSAQTTSNPPTPLPPCLLFRQSFRADDNEWETTTSRKTAVRGEWNNGRKLGIEKNCNSRITQRK